MRALVVVALAACGTGTAYRTTRIAPSGHMQYLAGLQVSGGGTMGMPQGGGDGAAAPLPELSTGVRRGFDDRYEAQLNTTLLSVGPAHTGSVELAGKVKLFEHDRWSLATGLGAGYRIAEYGGAIIEGGFVSAPLIGGIELGRHQLVVSADVGFERVYSSGAKPVDVPYAGGSIGFLWQIGKTWSLLSEIGSDISPTGNFMTAHSKLFHAGITAVWAR